MYIENIDVIIVERKIPISGVAKTYYHKSIAKRVFSGKSKKPLYITSVGIEAREAVTYIKNM